MHEISIARALFGLVCQHAPNDATVRRVNVRVGPLRAIEPDALQWAWKAITKDTKFGRSTLQLESLPWRLRCPACGRRWESGNPMEACPCGHPNPRPAGDDELTLLSLEVDQSIGHEPPRPDG